MSQFDTAVHIIMPFICLWELLVAAFAWSLDWRARANRYIAFMLVLLALNGYTQSRLAGAETLAQARPWLYVMATTTMPISAGACLVAFTLLRPDAWPQERRKRRLWQLGHVMVLTPLFLTLTDIVLGTSLFHTNLDPETYTGGFLSEDSYLQGIMSAPVNIILRYIMSLIALVLMIRTIWRDPQSTPLLRRRARWLLVIQISSPILAVGLSSVVGLLPAAASSGLVMASVYAIMLLRGMVSDRVLKHRLADVSLVAKLYISLSLSVLGLLIVSGITTYSSLSNQALVSRTLNRQRHLADLASDINTNLFDIQNKVFEFYNTWSLTGFEKTYQGGFQQAQSVHESTLAEKRAKIDADIFEIRQLNPEPETVADLERITRNINTYELTILEMSDNMERLGFYDSGLSGQVRETLDELVETLDRPGLEAFQASLVQLDLQTKEFFIRSDLASARQVSDLTRLHRAQVEAIPEDPKR